MNERKQLEEIKIIVGKAKNSFDEFGDTDYPKQDQLILSLFDEGKLDWLIKQAGRANKNAQDLHDMDLQLASEQKRVEELEKDHKDEFDTVNYLHKRNIELRKQNKRYLDLISGFLDSGYASDRVKQEFTKAVESEE